MLTPGAGPQAQLPQAVPLLNPPSSPHQSPIHPTPSPLPLSPSHSHSCSPTPSRLIPPSPFLRGSGLTLLLPSPLRLSLPRTGHCGGRAAQDPGRPGGVPAAPAGTHLVVLGQRAAQPAGGRGGGGGAAGHHGLAAAGVTVRCEGEMPQPRPCHGGGGQLHRRLWAAQAAAGRGGAGCAVRRLCACLPSAHTAAAPPLPLLLWTAAAGMLASWTSDGA
mmetsp:Transcript_8394/g.25362  ORF Transcript_8394/g.25362 Transcript_8394/m.25362 type:complete len:218 (+) Transcript_8394:119-772(+)|eukprot:356547-Chlamydomonas_euryale.AAC.1